ELSLYGDRKVDVDSAVDGAGLELARVGCRQRHFHPAVVGLDVEAGAIPVVAVEIDADAAVGRRAAQIAADVAQRYAAVDGLEFRGAAEIVDGDAAVPRVERQHHRARHADLEADTPGFILAGVRALSADAAAGGVDANSRHDAPRIRLGR